LNEKSDILEFRLDGLRAGIFERYLAQQNAGQDWTIFAVVSRSYDPAAAESVTKLQARAVPKKTAAKIAKLLKS
jgi:hypothetical protein